MSFFVTVLKYLNFRMNLIWSIYLMKPS